MTGSLVLGSSHDKNAGNVSSVRSTSHFVVSSSGSQVSGLKLTTTVDYRVGDTE